jgi:hypothetical protein
VFITVGYPVVVTSTIMTCFVRERSHPTLNRATIPGREHYGHHTVTPRDTQQHDVCPRSKRSAAGRGNERARIGRSPLINDDPIPEVVVALRDAAGPTMSTSDRFGRSTAAMHMRFAAIWTGDLEPVTTVGKSNHFCAHFRRVKNRAHCLPPSPPRGHRQLAFSHFSATATAYPGRSVEGNKINLHPCTTFTAFLTRDFPSQELPRNACRWCSGADRLETGRVVGRTDVLELGAPFVPRLLKPQRLKLECDETLRLDKFQLYDRQQRGVGDFLRLGVG